MKLMVEDWKSCDLRMRASWLSRHFRSRRHFHESLKELHFSEEKRRRRNDLIWKVVAQAHGIVATDLGEALEVELVRDHDGSISPSLRAYLYRNGMTPGYRVGPDCPLAEWFPRVRTHFSENRRNKQRKDIERILKARSDQVDIGSKGFVD